MNQLNAKTSEVGHLEEYQILPVHFQISDHYISLSEFISTAHTAQNVLRGLNEELFQGNLDIQLVVLPPREGSFLEQLGIILNGDSDFFENGLTIAGTLLFLKSEEGKALLRGLTKHELDYWFEEAGKLVRKGLIAASQPTINKIALLWILKTTCVAFLEKETKELIKIGIIPSKYRIAYTAKNQFYQVCAANLKIKAIGFDKEDKYSVGRTEFGSRLADIPAPVDANNTAKWISEIVDVDANSPNWDRRGRKWAAKCKDQDKYKEVTFEIEDENFWRHVDNKSIKTSIRDNLKLQWIYPAESARRTNIRVLRVLSYNGEFLGNPMTQPELDQLLHDHEIANDLQPDLFKRTS